MRSFDLIFPTHDDIKMLVFKIIDVGYFTNNKNSSIFIVHLLIGIDTIAKTIDNR